MADNPMGPKKRLGRWVVYGFCLVPAVVMLAYYWLQYIPSQRQYFTNLRFRMLATIGDQVSAKLAALASSLRYATQRRPEEVDPYVSNLVTELRYTAEECATANNPNRPRIVFVDADTLWFHAEKGCRAEAKLSRILSSAIKDDLFEKDRLFDDILIADSNRHVVYQRGRSSPRVVSLSELLKPLADAKPTLKEASGDDADMARTVRMGDSDFVLLIQPLRVAIPGAEEMTLSLCGLVHSERLSQEARHVPPVFLLIISAPLLIILLSGPFLKSALMTRTDRLAYGDMARLTWFTMFAAAMGTLTLVSLTEYGLAGRDSPSELERFATALNDGILSDLKEMLAKLKEVDRRLAPGANRDQTNAPALGRFEFVFWTDRKGCQAIKWTTKLYNTGRVPMFPESHFQRMLDGALWSLNGDPGNNFTLQTRVSPTTSQPIIVLAIPARHEKTQAQVCVPSAEIVEAAGIGNLPSLTGTVSSQGVLRPPLIPPDAGFAIFEHSGRVLFHSSPERGLHENLFEEVRSPARLQAAAAMRTGYEGPEYYRGRRFQFRVQPLTAIAGAQWSIAAFRELEPGEAMRGLVWGEAMALFLLSAVPLLLSWLAVSLYLRVRSRLSWREQVDVYLAWLWPDPARAQTYNRLAGELGVMFVIALAITVFGAANAYQRSAWLLPFCLLVPLAVIAWAVFRLRPAEEKTWDDPQTVPRQPAYIACVSLCLALVAVAPMLGLFSVCRAFEARLELMHWQQELRDLLPDGVKPQDSSPYVGAFWKTDLHDAQVLTPDAMPWWQNLLLLVRTGLEAETDAAESGALARNASDVSPLQWQTAQQDGGLRLILSSENATIASMLPEVSVPIPLGLLIALFVLGGAYAWNSLALRRMYLLDFRHVPLPELMALQPSTTRHVLVLGLPLSQKDQVVRDWLGYSPPRVLLHSEEISPWWVNHTIERLKRELTTIPKATVRAATGSISTHREAVSRPMWVHLSNLETKLANESDRKAVGELIQRLIIAEIGDARARVGLVVTSTIDPLFQFDSVLYDERRRVYEHPLTEPELQRISRVLQNFRKAQASSPAAEPADWPKGPAGAIALKECRGHKRLLEIGREVAQSVPEDLDREAVLARIAERAQALYELFWYCCTRPEKLLLIQLAQTGFVNPLCRDTLQELIRMGLIRPGARPRVMNETFGRFLRTVEAPDVVREWESEAGQSSWFVIRNVALGLIATGLIVMALTQNQALQTATAVITAVGTAVAGLLRLVGFFGKRAAAGGADVGEK
jgi:hypothetical protein